MTVERMENCDSSELSTSREMVSVEHVSKSFGDNRVLKDVSMSVGRGEIICLIGPSGSGKSTLLRCVNHLEKIDAGRILVDGALVGYEDLGGRLRELTGQALSRSRSEIGMVFQHFNLFPHLTVVGNIIEGPVRVRKESRVTATQHAMHLLERVGLTEKAAAYPSSLSGGQQQRVAIARALAMQPKLMLFDEPTSALDPELRGEVLEVMRGLATDGMTMLIVTHELGFAKELASTVAFLDDGVIVESGPPATVLTGPREARTAAFVASVSG